MLIFALQDQVKSVSGDGGFPVGQTNNDLLTLASCSMNQRNRNCHGYGASQRNADIVIYPGGQGLEKGGNRSTYYKDF